MTQERKTQPSNVSTEEAPRPPDKAVVTSDLDFEPEVAAGPREADSATDAAGEVTTDDASPTTGEPSDSTAPKKPTAKRRNRSAERRIKTMSKKLADAEAREAENAAEIADLKEQVTALQDATPKAKEPMLQDFANPREYAKAYAKWEGQAAETDPPKPRRRRSKPKPVHDDTPPATPQDEAIIGFRARGKEKLGDEFLEALEVPGTAVNQVMGEFMIDSDVGPELYVHLTDNQEEARKIYDMPAHKAVAALQRLATSARKGELEVGDEGAVHQEGGDENLGEELEAVVGDQETKPPPAGTKAPPPPSDVSPGTTTPSKNPESESMDEYAARRQKEELRKRGVIIN